MGLIELKDLQNAADRDKNHGKSHFRSPRNNNEAHIYIGIGTPFIPLSTPVYSHRGKMTVVIVKYFCKGQKHRRSYVGIDK